MVDSRMKVQAMGGDGRRQFASDNWSGVCPEAWAVLEEANAGHLPGYGDDVWTERACGMFRELFETDCEVFFTFNGTAANALSVATLCMPYHSVVCHELAHLETDECGAPEFFSGGTKVLTVGGAEGKVGVERVEGVVKRRNDIHYPMPRMLSVTQATELGTVYRAEEMGALGEATDRLGLALHVDGARFANAVATCGVSPADLTWRAGVDVLCFGGTKNGLPVGDAVVFFDKKRAGEFAYRCKGAGQLASKMRYLSAPWVGLLRDGVWLKNAERANHCARLLGKGLGAIEGVRLLAPVEANAVFVLFPQGVKDGLLEMGWRFYDFIAAGGCRLMCSWDTSEEDVRAFVSDVAGLCGRTAGQGV